MPSIKDTFDKGKYDSFLQSTNYTGALNYLTELQQGTNDYDEKKALQPFISNLRQKVHRDESMIRYADNETKRQQYYFLDAVKTGNSIEKGKNAIYDEYTNILAGLGDGDGVKASQLQFKFDNTKLYNNFLSSINAKDEDLIASNILIGNENGNKTISINKANPSFYKIVNAIYDIQRKAHYEAVKNQPLTPNFGDNFGWFSGPFTRMATSDLIHYRSVDNKGNIISNYNSMLDGKFNNSMARVANLMASAESTYNNLEKQATKDLIVSSFSLPWKTAAHARADELLSTTGDTEEYNKTIQRLDGQLAGALIGLNLSQQNVWATGDSDEPNYHSLTPEEKVAYQQILRDAIRDGRVGNAEDKLGGIHMAMLGDKFGYQIDILPKSDSKGMFPTPWDNSNIHRTIFIENPWPEESMTQAFESRTEFQAMKELILMNQYKYPFDMDDGSVLEMGNELMGVYKKSDGTVENVTREQALNLLNENFIKVRGAEALQRKYKSNASQRRYNIEAFENAIDSDAWAYALSAAEELVPKENKKAYMDKVYDLYQSILNGAGYKGKRAITIIDEE